MLRFASCSDMPNRRLKNSINCLPAAVGATLKPLHVSQLKLARICPGRAGGEFPEPPQAVQGPSRSGRRSFEMVMFCILAESIAMLTLSPSGCKGVSRW